MRRLVLVLLFVACVVAVEERCKRHGEPPPPAGQFCSQFSGSCTACADTNGACGYCGGAGNEQEQAQQRPGKKVF